MGFGFHLCRHLAGLRLRRFRYRRICPLDRGMAGQPHTPCRLCARRSGTGRSSTPAGIRPGASLGPRIAVSIDQVHRAPGEAGIEPSSGSVGDSYDNALAETINVLFKAQVIHRRGPWRSFDAVEYATLDWVDWFSNRRLLEPIGSIPPTEAEANYYAALETEATAA